MYRSTVIGLLLLLTALLAWAQAPEECSDFVHHNNDVSDNEDITGVIVERPAAPDPGATPAHALTP